MAQDPADPKKIRPSPAQPCCCRSAQVMEIAADNPRILLEIRPFLELPSEATRECKNPS